MKRKKGYETPLIEKFRVELEEGICASSVMQETGSRATTAQHETGFDSSVDGTHTFEGIG